MVVNALIGAAACTAVAIVSFLLGRQVGYVRGVNDFRQEFCRRVEKDFSVKGPGAKIFVEQILRQSLDDYK